MTNTSDRLGQLESIWPYGGPHDADTVTEAAEGISHLVRYLNNATRDQTTLPYAGSVDEVVSRLARATYGMDQLLKQLTTALMEHREHGRLYDGQDPGQSATVAAATATAAIELLRTAHGAAADLAVVLQHAHNATARLGHHHDA
jgi:hypothetical protein